MRQSPTSPVNAHHRMMLSLLKGTVFAPTPEELEKVSRVFVRAGGSWEHLFKGAVKDTTLLRKVLKIARKKGLLSKTSNWAE